MSSDPELRRWIKAARKAGWRVELGKGGHLKFYPPDKARGFVTVSATPTNRRGKLNALRDLKRAGLQIK